jgi:purine-binding chemotaxis protein CheW
MSSLFDTSGGAQFLTFSLGDETFAVPVAKVREILDYVPLTQVPQLPAFVAGVINLRGRVVPVIDLRMRFGLALLGQTRDTCIIVLEIEVEGELTEVGALVDGVQEVLTLDAGEVEPPPRFGLGLGSDLLAGLGKRDGRFVIILRPEHLLAAGETLQFSGLRGTEAGAAMAAEC